MHRPSGAVCRLVRGTRMIDLDPTWIYHLAEELTKLEMIKGNTPLSHYVWDLAAARNEIRAFGMHQQHTLFPETCEDLKDVLVWIDVILPPSEMPKERILTETEVVEFQTAISSSVDTFKKECKRRFMVGLENQRALDLKTLIEEIEVAFAAKCWNRLSMITKREIEECGKCLAFERYTAAGFHVLRALESEVRDYIWLLPVATPTKRDLGHYIGILKELSKSGISLIRQCAQRQGRGSSGNSSSILCISVSFQRR